MNCLYFFIAVAKCISKKMNGGAKRRHSSSGFDLSYSKKRDS